MTELERRLRDALPVWAKAEREAALYSLNVGDNFEQAQEAAGKEMNEAFEDFITKTKDALRGMMEIAELAMPDTFFQSDTRVQAARDILGEETT